MRLDFEGELWLFDNGSWHFVSVPLDQSEDLREEMAGRTGGFGSVRVEATIGSTTWQTSVFPSKTGEYVLPVKAQVRRAEGLAEGDRAAVRITTLL